MAGATIWAERVAAWRASGLSAAKFSAERGLRPRSLQRWSQRLGREDAAAPTVRLARLVRSPSPAAAAQASTDSAVVIELGGARITIGHGADVAMVVSVLAMVTGGAR